MLELLPNLRAFALSLTDNPTWADDLVQDTILRAWASMSHFEGGTNLSACLPMKSAEASDGNIYLAFNAAVAKVAKQLRRAKR